MAYSDDLGYIRLDREVRERFAEAVAAFAQATGATVEEAHPGLDSPLDVWNAIACGDNSASEGPLLASGLVGDDARALIEAGHGLSAEAYVDARNRAHEIAGAWAAFHARYDLLLTPTMECVAFPLSDWAPRELDGQPIGEFYDDYCHFCYPFNLTGQPVISVPMAPGSGGLPLGLQIAGRRFEDDLVLRAAAAWERAQPWESPSLAPAPAAAAAGRARWPPPQAGERVATIAGVDAWSLERAGARRRAVRARGRPAPARRACLESPRGRAGGLLPGRGMSSDPGADERRARRAELRRRQVRRRRVTGAVLLVALGGIGIWAAATLASGGDGSRSDHVHAIPPARRRSTRRRAARRLRPRPRPRRPAPLPI